MMTFFKRYLVLILLLSGQIFSLNIQSDTDTVLAMGKGMSKMRNMLEMYVMVGMKIHYGDPKARLNETIAGFEETLEAVSKHHKDDNTIMESLTRGTKAWVPLVEALRQMDPEKADKMKKNALFVHANMRSVIKEMEFIKDYLVKKSDIKDMKALSATLEIGASTQRLSSHYMMKIWKLDDPTIKEHWDKGVKKYRKSLEILRKSSYGTSTKFKKLLARSEKILNFMEVAFANSTPVPALVDKRANSAYDDAVMMVDILSKIILK